MTKPQGFLATFRIDEELWGKFKDIAKNNQTNASALIIGYIQGVVSSGDVDNVPKPTSPNIDISPQPNLDSIYKYIDSRIDNKINESVADGGIGEALVKNYSALADQVNGVFSELQKLQKQFEELQVATTAPTTTPTTAPTTAPTAPTTPTAPTAAVDIIELLGIQDIILGAPYDLKFLNNCCFDSLTHNKAIIEQELRIKLNFSDRKYVVREFNKIIRALGYEIENKQLNKVETYWVKLSKSTVHLTD